MEWEEINALWRALENAREAVGDLERNLKTLEVFVLAAMELKSCEQLAAKKRRKVNVNG